jgi:hypothetical protein
MTTREIVVAYIRAVEAQDLRLAGAVATDCAPHFTR